MITAVDTSVLIAIDQAESDAEAWVERLAEARAEGALVICDIVAAEFFASVGDQEAYNQTLHDLGVEMVATSFSTACLAGAIFRDYRKSGGKREHLIPDFLIGAHALNDCDALAAADRGYFRRYFKGLKILRP